MALQDLITDLQSVATALGDYSQQVGVYLTDPTQPLQHFSDFSENITSLNLETLASYTRYDMKSNNLGIVNDAAYASYSSLREQAMIEYTKSDIYQQGATELFNEQPQQQSQVGLTLTYLQSRDPEQTNLI